ncbi:hypothetical protein VOLCADRAFT_107766 [Volvox carteri f. nagariensis]|uniref:Uncharacterized protein n=1 Tax=Volvox carteri f. nagariensis TaxID=3068 RepID=D8UG95_VOLCA|nr:uncharacterized protein VOLCADRAFT_107766 [Volvox carteri f. nagariensis]EFJ41222.1 hypothetical protein VOLCADRAFT_107766 [Volvox carteri f. nagariensis]|eukprot:XP_002957673.1 hypothetical protein VOLCADRAFT_107766 [Volvox carteri f. nagariensis]
MAIDTLRMDGNQYASHSGTALGYGAYHGYDTYARQSMQMQPQRGPPLQPRQGHGYSGCYGRSLNVFKSQGFSHGGASKRKYDTFNQAPQGASLLHQLRADNLKKTRRHFQGSFEALESTPRIAPKAPDNRHGFLLSAGSGALPSGPKGALHAITPSAVPGGEEQLWKNSYGNADKEAVQLAAAAGLDFLGSFYDEGATLTFDEGLEAGERDDEVEDRGDTGVDASVAEQPPNTFDEEASFPPQAKRKLASQAAYIAQLEEQQLTLRERIFLLEQQLAEARRQRGASPCGHSDDADEASDEDRATSSSE